MTWSYKILLQEPFKIHKSWGLELSDKYLIRNLEAQGLTLTVKELNKTNKNNTDQIKCHYKNCLYFRISLLSLLCVDAHFVKATHYSNLSHQGTTACSGTPLKGIQICVLFL